MLTDLGRRFKQLFEALAESGNAPDTPDADERDMLDVSGEPGEPLTSFGHLRDMIPVLRVLTPAQPGANMSADEVAAWDMLCQHGFSRAALRASEELSAYEALNIRPGLEAGWRVSFTDGLLKQFEEKPEGLDAALLIAAEYGDAPLMDRIVELLDDAVTAERVPGETLLGGVQNAFMALDAGHFDPKDAERLRGLLSELVDRAEYHLSRSDPDGAWRGLFGEIRKR